MHPGERLNAASHLLGLLLALGGSAWLMQGLAQRAGADAVATAGAALFCAAAIVLLLASVACHSTLGRRQQAWQRADHGATFVLIAASYTPFALAMPRHDINIAVLAVLWLTAIAAGIQQARSLHAQPPSLLLYLAMGWCAVAAAWPVAARLSTPALILLAAGAAFYSLGTVFYRSGCKVPHAHGIWHLCVLAGLASHFAAVHWLLA
jgi:hemolysin III